MHPLQAKNKLFYTLLTLLGMALASFLVYSYTQPIPNPGHGADTIWVEIPGAGEMDLQTALDQNLIGGVSDEGEEGTFLCVPKTGFPDYGSTTTFYCPLALGANANIVDAGNLCCGLAPASQVELATVYIGVDTNGESPPDCWIIEGDNVPGKCTGKTWDFFSRTHGLCVDALAAYYNTLTNSDGTQGGWALQGWQDTQQASPCLDGSSNKLEVRLARYILPSLNTN